eukprot:1158560-Pelagomonas_calceolata.AAC.4
MSEILDLLLAGIDQPQVDQPNSLAEGLPASLLYQHQAYKSNVVANSPFYKSAPFTSAKLPV